jgi:hypothetical protein
MAHQNHGGTQLLGQPVERREHAAQRGIAVVVDPFKVSRNRVDHDQPAVAQAGGGGRDGVEVRAQAGKRLGAVGEDNRLEDVDLGQVRATCQQPRDDGPGRVVFGTHEDGAAGAVGSIAHR